MKTYAPLAAATLCVVAALSPPAAAQNRWSQFAVNNNWSNNANWDVGFAPDPGFDVEAIVGVNVLGAAPSANVVATGTTLAPTTILGDGAGGSGVLTIPAGSTFNTVVDLSTADFFVGRNGGSGVLNVAGTLNVAGSLRSGNNAGPSQVNLAAGSQVTVANATLTRRLRVEPGAGFNATTPDALGNGLVLGGSGVHTWVVSPSGPSTLRVKGNADLNGTLNVEFTGVTPTIGATWNLIDAQSVDALDPVPSGFTTVTSNVSASPSTGRRFVVNAVPSGASTNGVFAQLTYEQHPVLVVNRSTGVATLRNPGAGAAIGIDAYVVGSTMGALNPAAFSGGFAPATGWTEANPKATGISELNPTGTSALGAGASVSLGAIFAPPTPVVFGQENEDLRFRYSKPGGGFIEGTVVYEGLPNNTLVLNVNPTTGQAQLLNPSGFTVAIDSYVIRSASGSLNPSSWSSLQDQGANGGDWYEANPDSNTLSELLANDAATLSPNSGTIFNLGSPWVTGGLQDLVLQFALDGESVLRTGKVVYGPLVAGVALPGDYNGDNIVNAADYTVWRDANGTSATLPNDTTPGTVNQSDYNVWRANYGATLSSPAVAVPEPTAVALLLGVAVVPALSIRRNRRVAS